MDQHAAEALGHNFGYFRKNELHSFSYDTFSFVSVGQTVIQSATSHRGERLGVFSSLQQKRNSDERTINKLEKEYIDNKQ